MNDKIPQLDKFLIGELVDLRIPTDEFAFNSGWYSWFNDPKITRYLEQGIYPNTRQKQLSFFNELGDDRLTLIITDKDDTAIGVISLSFINLAKRSCDIAMVISDDGNKKDRPYISLEPMALIMKHGFEKLGMKRISAGQHIELKGWQQRLELLGYKLEGIHEDRFTKGEHVANTMSINASYDDYQYLLNRRGGALWDGLKKMRERLENLPELSLRDELDGFYNTTRADYYKTIFDL